MVKVEVLVANEVVHGWHSDTAATALLELADHYWHIEAGSKALEARCVQDGRLVWSFREEK